VWIWVQGGLARKGPRNQSHQRAPHAARADGVRRSRARGTTRRAHRRHNNLEKAPLSLSRKGPVGKLEVGQQHARQTCPPRPSRLRDRASCLGKYGLVRWQQQQRWRKGGK